MLLLENEEMRNDITQIITNMDSTFDNTNHTVDEMVSHVAFSFSFLQDINNNLERCGVENGNEEVTLFSPLPNVSTTLNSIEDVGPIWLELFNSVCKNINGKYGVPFLFF